MSDKSKEVSIIIVVFIIDLSQNKATLKLIMSQLYISNILKDSSNNRIYKKIKKPKINVAQIEFGRSKLLIY